jgi:putative ABC transport system permease protein
MFLRFVAQSLRQSPRRKLLTVAAVAMGSAVATAMLGAMLEIGDRVGSELRGMGANLRVVPKATALPVDIGGQRYRPLSREPFIPENLVPKLKSIFWHLNITGFAPALEASAQLGGGVAAPVDGVWFLRNYRAAGGERLATGLRALNPAWKVNGRWIDDANSDPQGRECMSGHALAGKLGVAPGSTVDLFGEPFRVVGVISTGGDEEDRIYIRLEALQRLTGRDGQVDAIQVGALTKPEDAFARKDRSRMTPAEYDRWYCTPYISSIALQIEEVLPMTVLRPVRRIADNEGQVLAKIRGLMLLVSLAALAAAGLTVWSAMASTLLERRGEIAIMQATGAGSGMVASLLCAEVAVQGLVGGILGVVAGSVLAQWVSRSVFQVQADLPATLGPLVVVVAIAVALAGAAQPLRRSLAMPPAIALRESI